MRRLTHNGTTLGLYLPREHFRPSKGPLYEFNCISLCACLLNFWFIVHVARNADLAMSSVSSPRAMAVQHFPIPAPSFGILTTLLYTEHSLRAADGILQSIIQDS